jgi:hypothetical protein
MFKKRKSHLSFGTGLGTLNPVKQKPLSRWLLAFLIGLANADSMAAQTKATSAVPSKPSVYANPARCKNRFDGSPDHVPELLKCLYEPYLSDETLMSAAPSTGVIASIAAPYLRLLLERERRCQLRRHEICALEQDVLIRAQDISNFVLRVVNFDRPSGIAAVIFVNGGETTFVYFRFTMERRRLVS